MYFPLDDFISKVEYETRDGINIEANRAFLKSRLEGEQCGIAQH